MTKIVPENAKKASKEILEKSREKNNKTLGDCSWKKINTNKHNHDKNCTRKCKKGF